MTDTVEACLANVDTETRRRLRTNDRDLTIRPCLEQCGICYAEPFLVFDGTLERGYDHQAILDAHDEK